MRQNLATSYRPHTFAGVVGQRATTAVLRKNVKLVIEGKAKAFQQVLLSGDSGLGKTTLARIYAAALNCTESTNGDTCGQCESCKQVWSNKGHPDIIEIDAASTGGKDEIKDIAAKSGLVPILGRYKVYIIDEAHGITSAGNQAFLKVLEEPADKTIFCLATTDPQKLALPIRSRCREFKMVRPTDNDVVKNLIRVAEKEGYSLDLDAGYEILSRTDVRGGIRATLMTLEKVMTLVSPGSIDINEVNKSLGASNIGSLEALWDAICRFDKVKTIEIGKELVNDYEVLRDFLIEKSKQELIKDSSGWRLNLVLSSGKSATDMLLLMYNLSSPSLSIKNATNDEQVETLRGMLELAEIRINKLETLLGDIPYEVDEPAILDKSDKEEIPLNLTKIELLEINTFLKKEIPLITNSKRVLALLNSSRVERHGKEIEFFIPPQLHQHAKNEKLKEIVKNIPIFEGHKFSVIFSRNKGNYRKYK